MKIKKPFFLILLLLLSVIIVFLTQRFFVLILSCLFISYMIRPLYQLINSFIKNRSASALISEFLFFSTLVFMIIFIINSLLSQLISISSPLLAENLISIENKTFFSLNLSQIDITNPLTYETLMTFGGALSGLAAKTPLVLLDVFLLTFITFYLVRSSDNIYKTIILMVPFQARDNVKRFVKKVDLLIKEIIYGYFLTALFVGLLTFILLKMLGVKYSVDYAIMSGLASLIPVIGNWIFPLFLAGYFFLKDNYFTSIALLLFAVSTSYLINMFRPIISKSKYKIHPILFMLGLIAGFYSLGILGFLIGPVLFGVVQSGFEEFLEKTRF